MRRPAGAIREPLRNPPADPSREIGYFFSSPDARRRLPPLETIAAVGFGASFFLPWGLLSRAGTMPDRSRFGSRYRADRYAAPANAVGGETSDV